MFVWGSTIHGQLGLGGIEEEHIIAPRKLDFSLDKNVVKAALGENHTLLLTKDGKVFTCGSNDYGQLGHDQPRKRPQLVSGLDAHPIVQIACGGAHSLALNQWGHVFSWGSDNSGQLGHQLGQHIQPVPKIIKALAAEHVVQIACGQKHSIVLTNGGKLFAWGANNIGQLGIGSVSAYETVPTLVSSLIGVPIAFITCGDNHTFCVSKSGAIFGWGKNSQGQLGLDNLNNRMYPTHLKCLRNIRVKYISCGQDFTAFLTQEGGVFTCGSGMFGQLGHGSSSNETMPRQIIELMGSTITQIACGRQHTLAYVPSRGRVYSFGLGGSGQLGLRKSNNASTPQVVLGPWVSPSGVAAINNTSPSSTNLVIKRIFAGGDHCLVTTVDKESRNSPGDYRLYETGTQIATLTYEYIKTCAEVGENHQADQDLLCYLEIVFKNLSCLNGSFLLDDLHYCCSSKNHGINVELAEKTFSLIGRIENNSIKELIFNSVIEDILRALLHQPPDVEALRIYLILPLYYEFSNAKQYLKLHTPFVNALLKLNQQATKVVGIWWCMMNADYFERLIVHFKAVVTFILRNQKIPENKTINYDISLVNVLNTLKLLNKLNHGPDGFKVPYDTFHITDLDEYLDVRVDYVLWLSDADTGKLFLCNYPFLFDAQAKTHLLETDQSIQMHNAMQNAAGQAMFSLLLQPLQPQIVTQFLVLNISRKKIVSDALRELCDVSASDLKKPLKVKFFGEEAEDAGGVKKEFFMLLLREILDPIYGMFISCEDTRVIWFSETPLEDKSMYFLIGIICGLAIYNFTIIDVPFPLVLYKKLLGESLGLIDLAELSPTVAKSLQSLLDYNEPDIDEVFCLSFEIMRIRFDEQIIIPLKENGSDIPVTQSNKHEYVNLYVNYLLNESVKTQYNAFHQGFMKVCDGRVIKLFHAHELMQVVIGNENYDWHALEEMAEYKQGYKSSDQTIRWFWEIIHEMSLQDKKKFLLFLTGSDRIPIQGMKAIKIVIQPTNDDRYFPVAHTCFNTLDLPRYQTKEKLKYKLMQAIQHTEGFTLV